MTLENAIRTAIQHHQLGRFADAETIYREVLTQQPENADALHLLGILSHQTGRSDVGAGLIKRAIAANPNRVEFYSNLSLALQSQRLYDEAADCLRKAIALNPNFPAAHANLASVLRLQGKLEESASHSRRALALDPNSAPAYGNLGNVLRDQGKFDEAFASYQKALERAPSDAEMHLNVANSFSEMNRIDHAIICARKAVQLRPQYPLAHHNLGSILEKSGDHIEAMASYQRALQFNPSFVPSLTDLGSLMLAQGELDEAMKLSRKAVELSPNLVEAHSNVGVCLQLQNKTDDALQSFDRALQINPEHASVHWNRSMALLLRGDFERGWPEYEWRWKYPGFTSKRPNFTQPQWNGGDLNGKTILLHAEQGLGDSIQFIRYAPLVAERGGRVLVVCQTELSRLFHSVDSVAQVIAHREPIPQFDLFSPLLSLPLALGTTLKTIPATVPYLHGEMKQVAEWDERMKTDKKLKVGLVWAGAADNVRDIERSLSLAQLAPLAAAKDVAFYSLQKEMPALQTSFPPQGMEIFDFTEDLTDFADTAAMVANLDLVISVDTAAAHLAGAMGKKVWTLLPFSPDWRWLLGRDDSPWYPSMTLFRQPKSGDWASVIASVADRLKQE